MNHLKITTLSHLVFFVSLVGFAQTPTISPEFFSPEDEITITYDVTETSFQNLNEAWIWMWLPDQGIDAPSNINPANSNSAATTIAKFDKSTDGSGNVFFSITLIPTTFYNQSAEQITSIGMLLKGNDWSDGQTEDYIATPTSGFTLILESPSGNFGFYDTSEEITISAKTSSEADIELFIDEVSVAAQPNVTEISFTHTIIDDGEVHEIKVIATDGTTSLEQKYTYTITPSTPEVTLPENTLPGINYLEDNTSVTLVLEAPNKENVFVIGEFNDWTIDDDYLMNKDGDFFWLTIENLTSGTEYLFQYLVDGTLRIADPYSEKISSPFDDIAIIAEDRYPGLKNFPSSETSEAATYLQTNKAEFEWEEFQRPNKEDLIIYELLIRDFTEERTFEAVTERLDYLQDLGVNAIELMPVMEFEDNISWGYNSAFLFAVDKYYGTELDLKTLINEAHKRGMAIILDIVLNHHFGRNSLVRLYNDGLYGTPTSENPWFNTVAKHDFNVGYDMNHENQSTKDYVDRVVTYWLEEYHVDGYRFDLSKGFTQKNTLGNESLFNEYDATRVAIWKRIADVIWNIDETAYLILEHFADNEEEKELANYGMMFWGNMNHTYRNAAKGSSTSFDWIYHESRGWNDPHVVGYMESHDEERLVWDLIDSGEDSVSAVERAKLAAAFFLTVPGPKMIWQFGEMGYDEELNNDRLGIKPTHWEYLDISYRNQLFNLYTALINLRTKTDYIKEEYFSWNTSPRVKTINIQHPDVDIYLIGNFDDEEQVANHAFTKTGTWYDYFSGEEIEVTNTREEVTLRAGQFFMYTSEKIENYIDDQNILVLSENPSVETFWYPNPTYGYLFINTSSPIKDVIIRDLSGRVIKQMSELKSTVLNLSNEPGGIYTIEYAVNNLTNIKKIIKK